MYTRRVWLLLVLLIGLIPLALSSASASNSQREYLPWAALMLEAEYLASAFEQLGCSCMHFEVNYSVSLSCELLMLYARYWFK